MSPKSKSVKKTPALIRIHVLKPQNSKVKGKGYQGFRHKDDLQWFVAHFQARKVIVERPIIGPTEGADPFYIAAVKKFDGWSRVLAMSSEANLTIVREFCSSLQQIKPDNNWGYKAYLRGKDVTLTPERLADFLGIVLISDFQCPFSADRDRPFRSTITQTLTGLDKSNWTEDGRLPKHTLTEEYRMLFLVVCASIMPTTFTNALDVYYARVVYAIGTGMKVSLPHLFIETITAPALTHDLGKALKFGSLITRLCLAAGVEEKVGDERKKPGSAVGESSIRRSMGQQKRKRVETDTSAAGVRGTRARLADASPFPDNALDMLKELLHRMSQVQAQLNSIDEHLERIDGRLTDLELQSTGDASPTRKTTAYSDVSDTF